MRRRGPLVVIVMLLVGTALGAYAWWSAYDRGKRSLDRWGSQVAVLIRYAPSVELWELSRSPRSDSASDLLLDGLPHSVSRRIDISEVKGLVHARHALVEDASFVWNGGNQPRAAEWAFALKFSGTQGETAIAFDIGGGRLQELGGSGTGLRLQPQLMATYAEKSQQWASAAARAEQR